MEAFPSNRQQNLFDRYAEERRNPTKGRTSQDNTRIMRTCHRFTANMHHLLQLTGHATLPWLPTKDAITDRDDDAIQDWRGVVENIIEDGYAIDEDGLLVNMQDFGQRASNRIEAVTTYRSVDEGVASDYMIRKTVYSPFPCESWGSLPLTFAQWRVIALVLIQSRVEWQWETAVNEYAASRDMAGDFRFLHTVGWNLVDCKRPARVSEHRQPETWTGTIMYNIATTASLNRNTANGCRT